MIRFLDILFSIVAIIFLLPLFLIVSVVLALTGENEIFYLQERVGKDKKVFKLFKFATMLKNSSEIGTGTITIKNDPRILPFGNILRKSKINELPQIFNILMGDMSVIGPRPMTEKNFKRYHEDIQIIVASEKPGLSGIGSIIFRDEEKLLFDANNVESFYEEVIAPFKGELECWFSDNKSIKVYFACIFLTIYSVLFPKNSLIWRVFQDLPVPPESLLKDLNYDK